MGNEELIKSTIRLPGDLHWRFQEEQARRRLSHDAAYREAVRRWIDSPKDAKVETHSAPLGGRWHQMLTEILESGDRDAIATVQQNILVFHRMVNSSAGEPARIKPNRIKPKKKQASR